MNIIEKLKYHEKDELGEWLENEEKISQKFLKELVAFSRDNLDEIKQYCINTLPTEFSSLSIIYEAFSEISTDFNAFLFEEIQRVVNLAKNKRIKPKYLEVLTDIETEEIYTKSKDIYIKIMNFLTTNLKLENDKNFNIELLDVIDWYFIESEEDEDEISESESWINQIEELANHGDLSVKIKAREVLQDLEISITLSPLSFVEKIKVIFIR